MPKAQARAYAACTFRRLGAAPSPRELWLKTVWSLGGFAMRTTTMKTTSLRIFGALLVLSVLWMMAPGVGAEDPIERLNETGQYQAKLFQETVQEYQGLRNSADEINSMRQDAQRRGRGDRCTPPAAPVAGPVAAPQVRFPAQAVPQQRPMPLDPVAFAQIVRQNQERVRQQILQTQQQIMQRHEEIIQQHQLLIMGRQQ